MLPNKEEYNRNQIGDYILNEQLGFGGFAKVVEGIHIPTGEKVAIKILDKSKLYSDPLSFKRIKLEISILKNIRHKNLIKLYEVMETPQKIYLIMEYCNGGELFNYIISKKHLSERQSCIFFHEIIDALEYLHVQNIVHRDIKPQNILLDTVNNEITLKIIDFGISNIYSLDNLLETSCGTASYAPPEMHKGNKYFGLLTDVWSAGIVLYIMNFGYLPFCEENEDKNINNIINGNYEIPEYANPDLKDFLKHLLDINPLTRYDFEQIKKHPWFNIVSSDGSRPGIIIGYNKIPVDESIINMCHDYGYDKEQVRQSIINNNYDSNSSIYYILLQKLKKKGIESVSDLYSKKYLNFINDPNNLLINNVNFNNERKEEKKLDTIENEKSIEVDKKISKEKYKKKNENNKQNKILDKKLSNRIDKEKAKIKNDNNYLKKKNSINSNINKNENKKIYENKTNIINNQKIKNNQQNKKKNNMPIIENRLRTMNSYFIHSNTKILLRNINTFKDYKVEEQLNNSFNEKLTDNIEEKILKLLNPKKREKNKLKVKEEIINLKLKIKNGKSFNEKPKNNRKSGSQKSKNKNKNSTLKNNKNNISKKIYGSIFKNEQEKHTVIHNRNASAENDKRRVNKNKILRGKFPNNISTHYNRKLSLSPINTNKNMTKLNKINIQKINISQSNNCNCNSNLVTKRNNKSSDLSEECEFINNNNYDNFNSNISNNIKVSKIIKKKKAKKKMIPQLLHIKKIDTNDYVNKINSNKKFHKDKSLELKSSKNKYPKMNNGRKNYMNNYNSNHNESEEKSQREYLTTKKSNLVFNSFYNTNKLKKSNLIYDSFYKTNKSIKKTIRINFKPIKENNNSNIMIYNNNSNKFKNNKLMLMTFDSSKIYTERRNCSVQSRKDFKDLKYVLSSDKKKIDNKKKNLKENIIKKDSNIKLNLMPKIKSMRNASVILNKIEKEEETPKKRIMNVSSFQYRNNKNMDKINEPRIYKGPIDIKNLIVYNSIKSLSDEIVEILKKNKVKMFRSTPYQFCCNKNGENFDINIYNISGKMNNDSKQLEDIIEINNYYENYEDIIKRSLYNKKNLFYYTIFTKKDKNNNAKSKVNSEMIQKIINKKFSLNFNQ